MSHELRTPLTSVLGFAKIIRKRLDEKIFPAVDRSDAKTEKTIGQISQNLEVVISEGERLTHLINDVLDLAKIEAGKMEWNLENVSMTEVAERALAATTLPQLLNILARCGDLLKCLGFASRLDFDARTRRLARFRNCVMHPVRPLIVDLSDVRKLVSAVQTMKGLCTQIGKLLESDSTV